jgi:hypothetical protein
MIQTVKQAPRMMKPKLNVCCVVLAAFSLADRSPHATLPSSLKGVTAFRLGWGAALDVPRPVCVAYNLAATIGLSADGKLKRETARLLSEFIVKVLQLNWDIVLCNSRILAR